MSKLAIYNSENYDSLEAAKEEGALYTCTMDVSDKSSTIAIGDILDAVQLTTRMIGMSSPIAAIDFEDGEGYVDLYSAIYPEEATTKKSKTIDVTFNIQSTTYYQLKKQMTVPSEWTGQQINAYIGLLAENQDSSDFSESGEGVWVTNECSYEEVE